MSQRNNPFESSKDKIRRLLPKWLRDEVISDDESKWLCRHVPLLDEKQLAEVFRHSRADAFKQYVGKELEIRAHQHLRSIHWSAKWIFGATMLGTAMAVAAFIKSCLSGY